MKEQQLAFPAIGTIAGKPNALNQPQMMSVYQSGMTLRDYFAAQALLSIAPSQFDGSFQSLDAVADLAYKTADAMIALRDRTTMGKEVTFGK